LTTKWRNRASFSKPIRRRRTTLFLGLQSDGGKSIRSFHESAKNALLRAVWQLPLSAKCGSCLITAHPRLSGFNLLLTTDKNMRYQQNLAQRAIAIVVLGNPRWSVAKRHVDRIVTAVDAAKPGSYFEVSIPDE
jgi:hypothetical protein